MLVRDDVFPRPPVTVKFLRDHGAHRVGDVAKIPARLAHDLFRDGTAAFISSEMLPGGYVTKASGYQAKRLEMPATIKADPAPERRRVTAIASTSDVDRHGDVVEQNWDLTAYRKNPVICRDHDAAAIVGRAIDIGVTGGRLMVEVEFLPAGVSEIADRTYAEIRANALNAVSVGFRVVEASPRDGGRGLRITKAELLEISFVGIPANASALITQRSMTTADRKALVRQLRADGRAAEVQHLRAIEPRATRPTKAALLAEVEALKAAGESIRRKYVRTTQGEG